MKVAWIAAALAGLASAGGAHEVWIERDRAGPVRIYLGEPAEVAPVGGDPEFAKLRAPRLLGGGSPAQLRRAGFIEVAAPAGDVRAWDDTVFVPWGAEGKKEGIVYYARAGRSEPKALLPFEIAPMSVGGDRFVVTRDGKAVPGGKVVVVTPDKWSKTLTTDSAGTFRVPMREPGRYLLSASAKDQGTFNTPGGAVAVLHRITTTTFTSR